MENPAPQTPMPEHLGRALDRELISPENTLFMCGVTPDELADHLAEFDKQASQEVLDLSAYRVAEILDTITDQINDLAIQNLGKEFLYALADLTISQVVVEERALIRHFAKEPDHNCEQESCPITTFGNEYELGETYAEPLVVQSAKPATTLNDDDFGSEWI